MLIVEDNPHIGGRLVRVFNAGGRLEASLEASGHRAVERILTEVPDLVLLDLGLPDLDGLEVLRQVRPFYLGPVVILSARAELEARVEGLQLGAEDYVTKPFEEQFVKALVERKLETWRRFREQVTPAPEPAPGPYVVGPLRVDPAARVATLRGAPLELTDAEFDLLAILARQPGVVVSKAVLHDLLQVVGCPLKVRPLDMLVSRLRAKLGDSGERQGCIRTVYGRGLCLLPWPEP
ncbi:MAG TPA: response regulator transcription factor [Myxococcota bacterium]|nr:response regulator transcription factor [Myxococcota bacterium]HRY94622.1 response regulator transcription factor [Myxococcota bacterium]HSA21493.1 response regulator transcription factor [Myxococcota bacterium]